MPHSAPPEVRVYQIRLQGLLDVSWSTAFSGLDVAHDQEGNTLLTGPLQDQSALYGLLRKLRDVGLPLLSLQCLEPQERNEP